MVSYYPRDPLVLCNAFPLKPLEKMQPKPKLLSSLPSVMPPCEPPPIFLLISLRRQSIKFRTLQLLGWRRQICVVQPTGVG